MIPKHATWLDTTEQNKARCPNYHVYEPSLQPTDAFAKVADIIITPKETILASEIILKNFYKESPFRV